MPKSYLHLVTLTKELENLIAKFEEDKRIAFGEGQPKEIKTGWLRVLTELSKASKQADRIVGRYHNQAGL